MAPPKITKVSNVSLQPAPDMQQKSTEIMRLVPSLTKEVDELTITDEASYGYADALLGRILTQKKSWAPIWDHIQEKTIKPIRNGLEALYEMNRAVEKPIERLESAVKDRMKAYKLAEARRLLAENEAREREAQRLREEAARKLAAEENARTAQMREKLRKQREALEQQADSVEDAESKPVQGVASSDRKTKKVRVIDVEQFVATLASLGVDPTLYLTIETAKLNRAFRDDPTIGEWAGVEVYDDISIVGR